MECAGVTGGTDLGYTSFSKYSWLDLVFSVMGLCTFLFDWGSDVWVATEFYKRGDFFWFGVMVALMVLSSVVVQMFSWAWLTYDRELEGFDEQTASQTVIFSDRWKLSCLLHVLQLGFFCRHISAIKQGFRVWRRNEQGSFAIYLTHDLSMLRLIETFCEGAPQLTLMIYIMLNTNSARIVQCVSVAASTTSIAWMVVDYHRSLRAFLPDKAKQRWSSSGVYFLWNLLLIGPRVAALALFASVLPRCVAGHFLALWPALVLWAWRQRTRFMEGVAGESLYRATVGLIWYFSWFNVAEGRTRGRSLVYHVFMAVDGALLLATWWCYRDPASTRPYAWALITALPLTHLVGMLLKALYYCRFHPTLREPPAPEGLPAEVPDGGAVFRRDFSVQDGRRSPQLVNKRMACHAANFYFARSQRLANRTERQSSAGAV